jgi:flagellar biogenesis protein FliO
MKNENLRAIVGLLLAIALVVVMGYILKLMNNI